MKTRRDRHLSGAVRAAALICLLCGAAGATQWPDISAPLPASGGGERDAAVIVGAENYAFVEHVPGARRNADDWQSYLTGELKVPADRVALLLDNDATLEEIRQAAVEKAAQVQPGGTLWFIFIGHGAPSKDGKDGLLVGIDAQQKAESVYGRSLSRGELLGILAKGAQARTVVLLDACFSGRAPSGRALVAGLQPLIAMRAATVSADARAVVMTAARSDQFAGPLPGEDRPAFSYLALGALRGWAADAQGRVTAAALVDYARRALNLSRDRTQTPELSTPGSADVVLGTGREAGPDLAGLEREAAASSGGGFEVTSLEAVPTPEAPKDLSREGVDFNGVDVDALEKYDAVVKYDKSAAFPSNKAEKWRQFGQAAPRFADMAEKRAREWDLFAAQKKAQERARDMSLKARDKDWDKLERLLSLDVVPEADKRSWTSRFLKAYLKSPGLDPRMAKALEPHAAPAARQALKALARRAPVEGSATVAWDVLEHLKKIKDYEDLDAMYDASGDDWLKSDAGKEVGDLLQGLRADAAATTVVKTPDGRVFQYSIRGQPVADTGISVADLDKDANYRESIAEAIAQNIMSDPLSPRVKAALDAYRASKAGGR